MPAQHGTHGTKETSNKSRKYKDGQPDLSLIGLRLLETRITTHFSGWKAICHLFSHSSIELRSFCRICVSLLFRIGRNNRQSSANSPKAVDKVPHRRLLHKLRYYGIRNNTFLWIQDFLSHRTQEVQLEGHKSRDGSTVERKLEYASEYW
jgi:hypothetical protein